MVPKPPQEEHFAIDNFPQSPPLIASASVMNPNIYILPKYLTSPIQVMSLFCIQQWFCLVLKLPFS